MISVIVPVYNVEKYISTCIESILAQDYEDFELIIVDDGSLDESGKIVDQYKDNPKIKIIHQINRGLSAARNAGLLQAKGQYVCFVDSDDTVAPNYLSSLYNTAVTYDADLVLGDYKEINELGQLLADDIVNGCVLDEVQLGRQTKCYETGIIPSEAIWEFMTKTYLNHYSIALIVAWNKLVKREIALANLFAEGKKHEDEFWVMPLYLSAKKVAWTSDIVYYYRIRNDGIMHTVEGDFKKEIEVLDAYEKRIELARTHGIPDEPFVKSYFENITNLRYRFATGGDILCKNCRRALRLRSTDALVKYGTYLSLKEFIRFIF